MRAVKDQFDPQHRLGAGPVRGTSDGGGEPGSAPRAGSTRPGSYGHWPGTRVHCGFCLPACPTYQLWGEEMDSPGGGSHLIEPPVDGAEGTAAAATHLDRCLGCMACVTACPSGVRYDRLIEAARVWTADGGGGADGAGGAGGADGAGGAGGQTARMARRARHRCPRARAGTGRYGPPSSGCSPTRAGSGRPSRRCAPPSGAGLDGLVERSGLTDRLPEEIAAALPAGAPRPARPRPPRTGAGPPGASPAPRALPPRVPARASAARSSACSPGCVQRVFFRRSTPRRPACWPAAEGCDVIVPDGQGCCGALSLTEAVGPLPGSRGARSRCSSWLAWTRSW